MCTYRQTVHFQWMTKSSEDENDDENGDDDYAGVKNAFSYSGDDDTNEHYHHDKCVERTGKYK